MKGYVPDAVLKIVAITIAAIISVIILVGLWAYKHIPRRWKDE